MLSPSLRGAGVSAATKALASLLQDLVPSLVLPLSQVPSVPKLE